TDAGEVAERLKAPHSKCGILARVSWVRIPPSPPWSDKPSVFGALVSPGMKAVPWMRTLRTPRVGSPIQQAGPEAQDAASGSQDSKRQRQPDITQADDADARLTIVQARAVIMDHLGRQAPQRRNRLTAPQSSEFAGEEAFDDVASV